MSESDILALIRGYATIPYRIYIEGNDTPLDEYEIVSTTYEDYRYVDTDSLVIGQFVARTFNGEIKNINRDLLIENKEIEVRMGVMVGDTTTWYSLGNFLITKPEEDDVKDKMTFKSMDYTKKFNKKFDPSSVAFPCTALELATAVCNQCGVELATTDFTNANFIIENNQYVEDESCRKVMQDIGKLAYSWVRIGWDNKCYIDFEVKTEVEDYNIITNDEYYDFSKQQKQFGVVNRVVVGMKDVDGENVAVQDDDSIAENGLCELHIYDNNLTYTPELRQQVIEGAKRLFGLKYVPVEVNTVGHPWLIGNELVRIIDMDGNAVDTYPFDRTIEYMGHIKTKLVSKAETQTQHEYVNNNTLGDLLNRTKLVVDKQNKTIQAVVEQSDETSKKVAEFGITLDGISSSVSNTEETVKDLESSIDYFSVDLSQYTLTIPVDSSNKPLETKNYDIPFYAYYKGKQVMPNLSIDSSNTGIITSKTDNYIRFSVNNTTAIEKLSNDYVLTFTYNSPDGFYNVVKKVTISLSVQGKDGTPGKDGTSVNILGSYNSLEELKQAHPTGNVGDAYIVQGDMYVWSTEENTWVDVGNIQGPKGDDGYTPQKGVDYFDGENGENGKSAYQIWLEQGNVGSEQDYLDSLKGQDGQDGYTPVKGKDYFDGNDGSDGKSAYQVWLDAGNTGTEQDYLDSLKGADGSDGYTPVKGKDYFDGADGQDGSDGRGIKSTNITYQIGTSGTTAPTGTWLSTIPTASAGQYVWTRTIITYTDNTTSTSYSVSKYGDDGSDGKDGYTPVKGKDYFDGADGKDGYTPQKGVDYFDGQDGKDGKDGTDSYFYVRYSANSNGNPMTQAPTTTTKYMGVASTTSPTAPTSYSAYTWSLIKGEDGVGTPGKDGESAYLHIKYSDDGKTFTANNGETVGRYRGELVDNNPNDSLVFSDYKWYDMSLIVDEELEEIRQNVKQNTALIEETDEQIRLDVAENYTSKGTFDEFKQTTETELSIQSNELTISVSSIQERLDILGTNIDGTTGEVTSVKTGKGFTFNDEGLNINDPNEEFNTQITNRATQYKNGDEVITETSKDGFMTTDLKEKGTHQYSYNGDTYDFVAERIEVDGEYAYAHFYNGGDL